MLQLAHHGQGEMWCGMVRCEGCARYRPCVSSSSLRLTAIDPSLYTDDDGELTVLASAVKLHIDSVTGT